jgi:hypothetical protein
MKNSPQAVADPSPLWGGAGVGGGSACSAVGWLQGSSRIHHHRNRRFSSSKHELVRNTQDREPLTCRPLIFRPVALLDLGQVVNAAIHLDQQPSTEIAEVKHVRPDRRLLPEMEAIDLLKQFPQPFFSRRHALPQTLRAPLHVRKMPLTVRHLRSPPPQPLLTRGRGCALPDAERYLAAADLCKPISRRIP